MKKMKVIPGRGLNGKDIKRRLANRSIQGEVFGEDAYMIDDRMIKFSRMSKVEQVTEARENLKRIAEMEEKVHQANTEKQRKLEEQRIDREVKTRMEQQLKQQLNENNTARNP